MTMQHTRSLIIDLIPDDVVERLRDEAGAHGDLEMVAICDIALGDRDPGVVGGEDWNAESARKRCHEVMEAAAKDD